MFVDDTKLVRTVNSKKIGECSKVGEYISKWQMKFIINNYSDACKYQTSDLVARVDRKRGT